MIITNTIKMDLARRGGLPRVDAVQGDENTRSVEISLYENGIPWEIPADINVAVSYKKPDGTSGLYDTLPDGTNAIDFGGNTVKFIMAPQMLTTHGLVDATVIMTAETNRVGTFPIQILVSEAPGAGAEKSENYYHYTTFEAINNAIGNLDNLETEDKSSLVAAINEVAKTGGSDSGQNLPLTTAQINALDGMFKVAAYDDSKDVSGAYAAFKAAFGLSDTGGEEPEEPDTPEVKTYTITTELVNVTSSNNEASVNEGASYTATLTAADGYELDTVSVLMGGVNVTADVYADGVISIASVTGNVEIVASAVMSEPGEITDAELLKDGLVDYFDFRNKTVTAGSGGLYYLNSDIGNGYMYSWYNFYFDEYGGKLGKGQTYANNRSTGYPAGENTLSGDVTICLFAKSLAYLYGLGSRNITTNTYNHNWSYKNADGESVSVESVAVTVPDGYNCITFVYSGAVAKLYVNGTVYTEMDCTDKEDFASHDIDWRFGTIDADHYVVAAAVYDRALTEVEVVEMGEYLKTLEVTA